MGQRRFCRDRRRHVFGQNLARYITKLECNGLTDVRKSNGLLGNYSFQLEVSTFKLSTSISLPNGALNLTSIVPPNGNDV